MLILRPQGRIGHACYLRGLPYSTAQSNSKARNLEPSLPCSIRWWRAVDVPTSKPDYFKYTPSRKPSQFEPFSRTDSDRLEQAYQQKDQRKIPVETDGLITVDFDQRLCYPTFWEGSTYEIRRGTWFEQLGSSKLSPLNEDDAAMLENAYINRNVVTLFNDGDEVLLDYKSDPPSAHTQDQTWVNAIKKFEVPKSRKFIRGFHPEAAISSPTPDKAEPANSSRAAPLGEEPEANIEKLNLAAIKNGLDKGGTKSGDTKSAAKKPKKESLTVRPSFVPRDVKHLLLCVHGIGQYVTHRYEFVNFVKDVDQFRGALGDVLKSTPSLKDHLPSNQSSNTFTQALPILWRNNLPENIHRPRSDPAFEKLKPQALFGRENILADIVLDFIMYTEQHHREAIVDTTAKLMNDAVREFRKLREYAAQISDIAQEDLKVSIVGHSLGSVIVNDLLRRDKSLDFEVENVFYMGSPVGVLDLVQGKNFTMDDMNAKNIYNIVRLSDPVSARLEPLVNPRAVKAPPVTLPGGGHSLIDTLRGFADELTARGAGISSSVQGFWDVLSRQFVGKSPLTNSEGTSGTESYLAKAAESINLSVSSPLGASILKDKTQVADDSFGPSTDLAPSSQILDDLAKFNRHGRLDFKVAEGVDLSLLVGIAGHLMYFDNPDVANFILREIHRAPVEFASPSLPKSKES